MKKILGLGNAIVDVLTFIEDESLFDKLGVTKGSMRLIDDNEVERILEEVVDYERYMIAGGSASNTISGLAKLGARTGFVGKIGDDEVGAFFKTDLQETGVRTHLFSSELLSGQSMILISPDGERTMNTYLGAACELVPEDLNDHIFGGYDYFHIEGYLVQNHDLIRKAVQLAKKNGLKVSIDLASFNVVAENLDFLQQIIMDYVDIVFANEEEARSLTGLEPVDALHEIASMCEIAVVKVGKDGSYVKAQGKEYRIQAICADCVDTTGAGDLFASGFLYGLTLGLPFDKCGQIGSVTAGNVVEVPGAKMDEERWEIIRDKINQIISS